MLRDLMSFLLLLLFAVAVSGCGSDSSGPPTLPTAEAGGDDEENESSGDDEGDDEGDEEGESPGEEGGDDDPDGKTKPEAGDADVVEDEEVVEADTDVAEGDGEEGGDDTDIVEADDADDVEEEDDATDVAEEEDTYVAVDCNSDEDCLELPVGACDVAVCMPDFKCLAIPNDVPECCESALDCDDGNTLTVDTCPGPGESCEHQTDNTACEQNEVYLSSNFDDGTPQGWVFQRYLPLDNDSVDWHVSARRAGDGSFSLRFGNKQCPTIYNKDLSENCDCGELDCVEQDVANDLTYTAAISPEMNIQGDSVVLMKAKIWTDLENVGSQEEVQEVLDALNALNEPDDTDLTPQDFDSVYFFVQYTEEVDGEFTTISVPLWTTYDVQHSTDGVFIDVAADLSTYAGKVIRLVLEAKAEPQNNFPFEGFYIDSVEVKTGCNGILGCTVGADECVSPNPCVTATCMEFVNEGGGSACFASKKWPTCTPCLSGQDFECGDNDSCTLDACIEQTCSYETSLDCCEEDSTWGPYEYEEGELPPGWEASEPVNGVGWTIATLAPKDGVHHLYFGNPDTGDFDAGDETPAGTLTTPMFQLPDTGGYLMGSFDLMLLTELLGFDPNPLLGISPDRFVVDLLYSDNGVEVTDTVFDSYDIGGATGTSEEDYGYVVVNFDLTAYAGSPVRFRLSFDAADDQGNSSGGVFIDNFGVYSVCTEPTCEVAADCDDGSICTTDSCVLGTCENIKEDPLCCTANGDCDDDNPCTVEVCEIEGEIGQCAVSIPDPSCCFEKDDVFESFDGEPEEWTFGGSDVDVAWNFIEGDGETGLDGSGYLYFGNPETGSYQTTSESLVFGQTFTPPMTVEPSGISVLSFQLNLSTEWDSKPFVQLPFPTDRLTVYVQREEGESIEVWNSDLISGTTQGQWQTIEVGLAAFVGETIQFKLEFNTGDNEDNDFAGVMIDDMNIGVVCSDVECFSPFECSEDNNPCTIPACFDNLCGFEQVDTVECCIVKAKQSSAFEGDGESSDSGYEVSSFKCGDTSGFNPTNPDWDPTAGNCLEDSEAAVKWHISDTRSHDGTYSLYFGKANLEEGETMSFADGEGDDANAVAGYVVGPPVALYEGKTARFEAWAYVDVETYNDLIKTDNLHVLVIDESGVKHNIWGKQNLEEFQYKNWVKIESDLSVFEGQVIQLMVYFDSFDNIDNDGEGVYLDEIEVIQECDNL